MNYIEECLQRSEKATPGPWVNRPHGVIQTQNESITIPKEGIVFWDDSGKADNSKGTENYDFIAHARQDVPELCARLTRAIRYIRATRSEFDPALADELEAPIVHSSHSASQAKEPQ